MPILKPKQSSDEIFDKILKSLSRIEAYTCMNSKPFLTIDECCVYTRLSKGYIYSLTCTKKIPFCKRGRKLYFDKEAINKWLTMYKTSTQQEVESMAATYVALHKK